MTLNTGRCLSPKFWLLGFWEYLFLGIFNFWLFSVLLAILGVFSLYCNSGNLHSANFHFHSTKLKEGVLEPPSSSSRYNTGPHTC